MKKNYLNLGCLILLVIGCSACDGIPVPIPFVDPVEIRETSEFPLDDIAISSSITMDPTSQNGVMSVDLTVGGDITFVHRLAGRDVIRVTTDIGVFQASNANSPIQIPFEFNSVELIEVGFYRDNSLAAGYEVNINPNVFPTLGFSPAILDDASKQTEIRLGHEGLSQIIQLPENVNPFLSFDRVVCTDRGEIIIDSEAPNMSNRGSRPVSDDIRNIESLDNGQVFLVASADSLLTANRRDGLSSGQYDTCNSTMSSGIRLEAGTIDGRLLIPTGIDTAPGRFFGNELPELLTISHTGSSPGISSSVSLTSNTAVTVQIGSSAIE